MTAADKSRIVAAGRAALKEWLEAAERHGMIYYTIPHVARSGMSRRITLHTICFTPTENKAYLGTLYPHGDPNDDKPSSYDWQTELDMLARDWGFSLKAGAFVVGGCGMDMVFHLIDTLAHKAGIDGHGRDSFANRVRRASV